MRENRKHVTQNKKKFNIKSKVRKCKSVRNWACNISWFEHIYVLKSSVHWTNKRKKREKKNNEQSVGFDLSPVTCVSVSILFAIFIRYFIFYRILSCLVDLLRWFQLGWKKKYRTKLFGSDKNDGNNSDFHHQNDFANEKEHTENHCKWQYIFFSLLNSTKWL